MFCSKAAPLFSLLSLMLVFGAGMERAIAGPSNRHYMGGGAQIGSGKHRITIGAKAQIRSFGRTSLSVRPDVIVGDTVQARVAVTAEHQIGNVLSPYLGGGLSYNADDLRSIDPMASAGVDINLNPRIVVRVGGNAIFQDEGVKSEAMVTGNYAFGQ